MGIFDSLSKHGGSQAAQQQMNPMQMMGQLRSDPAKMLGQAGFNIPAGMNNPQQIVQHLMQSGQLPQGRLQQAMQMAQMMGRR